MTLLLKLRVARFAIGCRCFFVFALQDSLLGSCARSGRIIRERPSYVAGDDDSFCPQVEFLMKTVLHFKRVPVTHHKMNVNPKTSTSRYCPSRTCSRTAALCDPVLCTVPYRTHFSFPLLLVSIRYQFDPRPSFDRRAPVRQLSFQVVFSTLHWINENTSQLHASTSWSGIY